jgi:hypothetical protein
VEQVLEKWSWGRAHADAGATAPPRRLVSSQEHEQIRIPGRQILREVIDAYQPSRQTIADRRTRVLILRFDATGAGPEMWVMRMRASAISAEHKVGMFTALGAQAEDLVFPDTVSAAEFIDVRGAGGSRRIP